MPWFSKYRENPFGVHFRRAQEEPETKAKFGSRFQISKNRASGKRQVHFLDHKETHCTIKPDSKRRQTQKDGPADLRRGLNQKSPSYRRPLLS